MTELDFESAQLELLTEALRAGPGTPAWREALATLEHAPGADEYKLLYTARERLASGRRYREVRAGQGFTRKVFDAIDEEEGSRAKRLPSANLIAAASALVILSVLAVVAYFVMPLGDRTGTTELSQTYFVNTLSSSRFDGELGMEWAAFGPLGVEPRDGLRPVLKELPENFRGGGVFYTRTLAPEQPFAIEATIRVARPSDDLVVQLFVTDDADFTGESATSGHELVWLARGGEVSLVLPGGQVQAQSIRLHAARTPAEVRISVNRHEASVEMNGQKIWSGEHALDGTKGRLAGVRFLARGGEKEGAAVVESVRVLVPQKQ